MKSKKCSVCGKTKSLSDFYRNGKRWRADCKACNRHKAVTRYAKRTPAQRNKMRTYKKVYDETNRDKKNEYNKSYYEKNRQKILKQVRRNREKIWKFIKKKWADDHSIWGVNKVVKIDNHDMYIQLANSDQCVIIDTINYWMVRPFRIYLSPQNYATVSVAAGVHTPIHRILMKADKDVCIDHKNTDRLDCRVANLRFCTRQENTFNQGLRKNNTSGAKGVSWHKRAKKWQVALKYNKKSIYLGMFGDFEEAVRVADAAYKKYHGDFARTNKMIKEQDNG